MSRRLWLLAAWLSASPLAWPHGLHYSVGEGQAVVVRLTYADDTAFSFAAYEIYPEGERLPVQVGRTDAQGRIAFLPDKAGRWRIKAASEDGHGIDFTLTTDAAARVADSDRPFYERHGRIVAGVALILGLFGLIHLYLRRKRT
jgi:nickel transport protein